MTLQTHPSRFTALAAALLVAACGDAGLAEPEASASLSSASTAPTAVAAAADPADAPTTKAAPGARVPGRYIVTLRDDAVGAGDANATAATVGRMADSMVRPLGGQVGFVYGRALKGFSATLPDAAVQALRNNPNVAAIEADQTVTASVTEQVPATWGLDRIDQRLLPLTTSYRYASTASSVTVFIVDTGIRSTHTEFRTAIGSAASRVRADLGYTAIADGAGTEDCNGHGTHVAGTVAGLNYGVAKQAALVPVRVLGCDGSGTTSGVIAGVDFVARSTVRPAVANLSLGGGASSAMDTAIANATAAGVTMVVAAGNSNANACNYSPARAPSAITVGATTSTDARSSFSNFGSCLDLFAPGSAITSAVQTSDTATASYNGTSMASPHVAGAVALVLAANPAATPAMVTDAIKANATTGRVGSAGTGSPNLLLFTNPDGASPPPAVVMVSVRSLAGSAVRVNNSNWYANVTITVKNAAGATVPGATVTARYSTASSAQTCVTGSTGACTIRSANLSRSRIASTTLTVNGITGSGMQYDAAANAVGSVTVNRI